MRFIGQVALRDAGLGAAHADRIAYLFMTNSEIYNGGAPYVDGQYDPSLGENAVIIQPGTHRPVDTRPMVEGPTLLARSPGFYLPDRGKSVEFAVSLTEDIDPAYRTLVDLFGPPVFIGAVVRTTRADAVLPPVDPREIQMAEERRRSAEAHFDAITGNKLGGAPPPYDSRALPVPPEQARLILQLDMGEVPFFVDFGDVGVGHLFLDAESDRAYFTYTSG